MQLRFYAAARHVIRVHRRMRLQRVCWPRPRGQCNALCRAGGARLQKHPRDSKRAPAPLLTEPLEAPPALLLTGPLEAPPAPWARIRVSWNNTVQPAEATRALAKPFAPGGQSYTGGPSVYGVARQVGHARVSRRSGRRRNLAA